MGKCDILLARLRDVEKKKEVTERETAKRNVDDTKGGLSDTPKSVADGTKEGFSKIALGTDADGTSGRKSKPVADGTDAPGLDAEGTTGSTHITTVADGTDGGTKSTTKVAAEKKRGRTPTFAAARLCEGDIARANAIQSRHATTEPDYALEQFDLFKQLNDDEKGNIDLLPLFIGQAINQGLSASSAMTYFTTLSSLYPPPKSCMRSRAAFATAVSAEKAMLDGKPPTQLAADDLLAAVQGMDDEWILFAWVVFSTGCRPVDALFLTGRQMKITTDTLIVEWRITKGSKERSKRHDAHYPLRYSAPWPKPICKKLNEHQGTFEGLSGKGSVATKFNAHLLKSCAALKMPPFTSGAFRNAMEHHLRRDKANDETIARLMNHAASIGEAHYALTTSREPQKGKAKKESS